MAESRARFPFVFSAALLLLISCADISGPVDIYVVHYDPVSHEMVLSAERVETIASVAQGRGTTTRLIKEPAARSVGGDLVLEGGVPPTIMFTERDDGTIIPQDWDSLTLLSYYHHLEQTVAWFQALGFNAEALVPLSSYYRLEVGIDQTFVGLTDNAAYLPTAHAFLLFESFFLNDIPLAMNDGVVTHEFGHAVFHNIMNGTNRLPIEYRDDWPIKAQDHLGSVHEGQADIWAGMQFDEADFFQFSFSGYEDRDMSVERILDSTQKAALDEGKAEVHEIGAIIAAAVWQFSEDIGGDRARTAELQLSAEQALAANDLTPDFELTDYLQRFADAGTPAEHTAACNLFCVRFDLLKTGFPTCACP